MLSRLTRKWVVGASAGLLLDSISATAAFSVRKLRTAYAGACLRVRRSSDNAEANIGFDASGNLDTAALLTHVGAGSGYVRTWYDQSGNGNNVTTATQADQPAIVSAGAVLMKNSKPVLGFTPGFLKCAMGSPLTGSNLAAFGVLTIESGSDAWGRVLAFSGGGGLWDWQSGNSIPLLRNDENAVVEGNMEGANLGNASITYGAYSQFSSIGESGTHVMRKDGVQTGTAGYSIALSSNTIYVGGSEANLPTTRNAWSYMGEVIAINATASAFQTIIETSQKAYFGTP